MGVAWTGVDGNMVRVDIALKKKAYGETQPTIARWVLPGQEILSLISRLSNLLFFVLLFLTDQPPPRSMDSPSSTLSFISYTDTLLTLRPSHVYDLTTPKSVLAFDPRYHLTRLVVRECSRNQYGVTVSRSL